MVLAEIKRLPVASVLDIGAGSGAASLAAQEIFPEAAITMVEREPVLAEAARKWLPDARVIVTDAARLDPIPPHDLVVAAYSLGEIPAAMAAKLWMAARLALVVIEPGTPKGFALVRVIRAELLSTGAHMVAPCPGAMDCPMADPDWCHFAARVERSSLHRRLKGGDLGYEDEKFSYVVVARERAEVALSRIVRRPTHQPGLITLDLCTPSGLRKERVTRRDRDRFGAARRARWGDAGV
jgi:ribosomal protein RSM22 (predicted rRNA methylase)